MQEGVIEQARSLCVYWCVGQIRHGFYKGGTFYSKENVGPLEVSRKKSDLTLEKNHLGYSRRTRWKQGDQ